MNLPGQLDKAILEFSRGEFNRAIVILQAVIKEEAGCFEAQLAFGMACLRQGNFNEAIAAGHQAERMNPIEPLVHTNLSLFYLKAGDLAKAEHHHMQARIANWRKETTVAATAGHSGVSSPPSGDQGSPKVKIIRMPGHISQSRRKTMNNQMSS